MYQLEFFFFSLFNKLCLLTYATYRNRTLVMAVSASDGDQRIISEELELSLEEVCCFAVVYGVPDLASYMYLRSHASNTLYVVNIRIT